MIRTGLSHAMFAAALAFLFHSAPAEAQLFRTWVASNGSNSNPCSRAAPCATFQAAINQTNAGGEINCVDAGEYGTAGILKPLTIDCAGTLAAIGSGSGTQPIIVQISEATFPNAVVRLRNLTVNAAGFTGNGIGIQGGGAEVHIENCVITGVGAGRFAILFLPTSSLDLFVRDTFIGGNTGGAMLATPATSTLIRVSLNNVRLDHNGAGISVPRSNLGTAVVILEDVQIENSAGIGIEADGAAAFVFLSNSTVTLNGTALSATNGGKIFSFGNNTVAANANVGSTPTLLQQQ